MADCPAPFGTVPIYQVMVEAKSLEEVKADWFLDIVEHHAKQGVDFVTVHCGVSRAAVPLLKKRVTGVVSRGGPSPWPGCAATARKTPCWPNMTGC